MASKPAHRKTPPPSAPPQSMRRARPERMRSRPITSASTPVVQALEFEVQWLPRPSRPAARAEGPLAITC